ncbi:hypothetical protein EPN87_03220 [archaeon]|nr:MAG: hypothetical protein EPN87_03220 [archaeon]
MRVNPSTVYLIVGIIIAIAVSAFVYYWGVPNYTTTKGLTPEQPILRSFTIHGSSYEFDTSRIVVKKDDAVKIEFISDDTSHNLCIEGYGCTQLVSGGASSVLSFVAKDAGIYSFYCNVDSHRQQGMEGQLIVEQ